MKMQRSAGILLPVSSLPSPYGIGCFSQEAYDFVDWLKDAGQTYWQILPLGVTSYGDSPYQSFSAFAGNPYFISLDALVEEGVLTAAECKKASFGRKADDIDYSRLYAERGRLLRLAYSRSDIGHNEAFTAFCEKNKGWLDDFALFMAVKGRFEGKPWIEWAEDIRLRWQPAMDYYRRELYFEVEYHKYLQFKFDQQWRRLKAYANSKGIRIIGDIPIYVALDSADAWANPGLFQLDKDNIPTAVAGVPPDGFSPTGQLWGNPLYREIADIKDFSTGQLSIGVSHTRGRFILPEILPTYQSEFPGIELHLIEGNSSELANDLLHGTIDLMIDLLPFTAENVDTVPICQEEILLVVPDEVLKKVALGQKEADRRILKLSGGQQRVAIARALSYSPQILVADEPTGNLDPGNSMEIMKLLEEINNRGTTVLVVTHNREIVNSMKKRVITMRKGVVVSDEKEGEYHEV